MLGISVSKVLVFLFTSFLARFLIKAFAVDPWMYYLGGLVDIISTYSFSILKAMTVLCVSPNELGKINAVLAALEGLLPVLGVYGYTSLWNVMTLIHLFVVIIHEG